MTTHDTDMPPPVRTGVISRGRFVRTVGTAALAGACLPLGSSLLPVSAASVVPRASGLHLAGFHSAVGESFRIQSGGRIVPVSLVRVTDLLTGVRAQGRGGECFSLHFRSPRPSSLSQGTYRFEHAFLGTFPLFIVPEGPEKGSGEYHAVVNRME